MKKLLITTSLLAVAFAFNSKGGWKLDSDGKIEMKDGNPVFLDADGKEMVADGDTIGRLNNESRKFRERAEKAEDKLKTFDGIDVEKAKKAIETVANIDAKKLIDAGEVDKVRTEISQQFTAQIAEKDKEIATLKSDKNTMMIDGVFANSDFIRDSVAMPRDFFTSTMRQHFTVEDGQIVVKGKDGNRLMSKEKIGEFATPEEGLRLLVDMHPQKDTILKAGSGSGSGSGGNGGNSGQGRSMKRSEFDAIENASKKSEIAQKVAKGEMNLVD